MMMMRRCRSLTLVVPTVLIWGVLMIIPEPTEAADTCVYPYKSQGDQCQDCPAPSTSQGRQCLNYVPTTGTWQQSYDNCANHKLASLTRESSDAVLFFLKSQKREKIDLAYWVGGSDTASQGTWKWVDTTFVDVLWVRGQPQQDDGDCLAVNYTGFFAHKCNCILPSICEIAKPGYCPPVSIHCARFAKPPPCSTDFDCPGTEKCCPNDCSEDHTCKTARGLLKDN